MKVPYPYILQCMSAKRTAWNEFSSSMASAVIYLSTETPLVVVDDSVPTADVADDVPAADAEPTPPSPPPPQELPSISQVLPTPPSSPIAQPSSPP
nr:hypothetical protein [Tanacetum cinerariifolium]